MTKKIDHSRGRIEILNGDIFYSPNPPMNGGPVVLPKYQDPEHHIFSLHSGIQWRHLLLPRWYASRSIFLSFLTLNPVTTGYPFDRLAHIPAQDYIDGQYVLKEEGRESWSKLEQDLILITMHLRIASGSRLFVDRPFAPWAFGYSRPSQSHKVMKKRAGLSRDWFQIWIALLSYLIACLETDDNDPIPAWYILLKSNGYDELLLNGIRSSDAVNFSPDVPRVGTFLDINDASAPPPDWFIKFGLPVWYHLSTSMINAAPDNPWSKFVPPPELMATQRKPSLTTSPRPPVSSSSPGLSGSYISWQDFFARRAALNEHTLQRESAHDREVRLNRERQPPTRRTKVFEWTTGDDPNDNRLYRRPVFSTSFEDAFESYFPSQRRYDSFRNEWDLCEEFAPIPGGGYDDSEDSDDDFFREPGPGDIQVGDIQDKDLIPNARPPSPIRFAEQSDSWRPPFPVLNNPVKFLSLRYGFTHPLTSSGRLPAHFTDAQKKSWTEILHLAGLSVETEKRFPVEAFFDQNLIAFFDALCSRQRPPRDQWDLDRDNRHSILFSDQLQNVFAGPSGGYRVIFSNSPFPWTLWLPNAVDVLHICRVQQELRNQHDTARYLVENGFRFRTLLRLESTPPTPTLLKLPVVPFRSSGYTFTQKDFAVYEQQRAALLATSRARAFLLRGGIAWRLARDTLSLEDALDGPSSPLDVYQSGYYVQRDGEYWGDNDISAAELNLLSGLYICFTGKRVVQVFQLGNVD